MEKELFIKFVASYFYKKGKTDSDLDVLSNADHKTMHEYLNDCKKAYKVEIIEQRKANPHHHMNRLD